VGLVCIVPAELTVLVADDEPANLRVLGELLRSSYRVRVANTGARALQVADTAPRPDLILLDIMMPDMDGYTVLESLRARADTRDIPVIFVTSMDGSADEERGLELGAVDYITKPFQPAVVLARVRTHLELKQARDWLKDQNAFLEAEVNRRMAENVLIQDASILALAGLAAARDTETGNHLRRTQGYVRALAVQLGRHPRHAAQFTPRYVESLAKSAPLHDIGKVGIPDCILLKPGKLTADEWAVMQTHARLGSDAIESAERDGAQPIDFLAIAKEIARCHHEKWDGSGYPAGLRGEAIPISARLMALADVYDALTTPRPYKDPMPTEQVEAMIVAGQGTHFDPDVVDAFLTVRATFALIAGQWADTAEILERKLATRAGLAAPP
jgi:putative two-component system response regulator